MQQRDSKKSAPATLYCRCGKLNTTHKNDIARQRPSFYLIARRLGWPRTMYYFAKMRLNYKFRRDLKSWDHSTLNLLIKLFSKPLFRGREIHLKMQKKLSIHHFDLLHRKKVQIINTFLVINLSALPISMFRRAAVLLLL